MKNEMRKTLGIRQNNMRDPADNALSLDEPLVDGSGSTLGDTINDDDIQDWLDVEGEGQWKDLHVAIGRIKSENVRKALIAYYWVGKSSTQIANDCGVTGAEIIRRINRGLFLLRNDNAIKKLAADNDSRYDMPKEK